MIKIFIAGSRKFYQEIETLVEILKQNGFQPLIPHKELTKNDEVSQKKALIEAFTQIKISDYVFVVANDGYVGETVISEVSYAYSFHKTIILSEKTHSVIVNALAQEIIPFTQLVTRLQAR